MKFNKALNKIALLGLSVLILNACKKIATTDPIGDAGTTYVHLLGGGDAPNPGASLLGVDFVNRPQSIDVADVRRDAANGSDLSVPFTVVLKDDTAAIRAYNTANGTSYVNLPRIWYTANVPATSMGGTYTLPFASGDFAKQVTITIPNATLLDPSTTYALAFTLISNSGGFKNATGKTFIFAVGAKNSYDGVYSVVSGFVQRYSGPGPTNPICCDGLTGPVGPAQGNPDISLTTTGAYSNVFGPGVGVTWSSAAGVGGIDGLRLSVDPVTNLVTMSSTANLTLGNWAGRINKYDPATKTFTLAFNWNPVTTTREYEIVLKYKKAR